MSGGGRGPLLPQRSISESKPGMPSAEVVGISFAKSVGIEGTGPEALRKLRSIPADQVVQGLSLMTMEPALGAPETYVGGPLLDSYFVMSTPDVAIANKQAAPVTVMIGSTTADIGFSSAASLEQLFSSFGAKAAIAREAYDPEAKGDLKQLAPMVAMDRFMTEPARHVARLVTANGQAAYYYRFGYVADSMKSEWVTGAPHATDIPWAFNTVEAKYGSALTARDRAVARTWNLYFTHFAKSGDPNSPGQPQWQAYARSSEFMMLITPEGMATGGADPWTPRLDLITDSAGQATIH
jgi:para-nitrobenzyl esterase